MSAAETVDADFRPLAVAEPAPPPPAMFGTDDPVEVVAKATRVADALKAVVVSKGLVSKIQGKEYPQVEAWQTLAAMLRLSSVLEWSRRCEGGWEARVVVRDSTGRDVGAGEAQCTREERSWKNRDDFALRAMAQTRATSRALRSVLAFVMVLAGYSPTPAEEMPHEPSGDASEGSGAAVNSRRAESRNEPATVQNVGNHDAARSSTQKQREKLHRAFAALGLVSPSDFAAYGTDGDLAKMSYNEANRIGKLLADATCEVCKKKILTEGHEWDGYGMPCPSDTSPEAIKALAEAAARERGYESEELPL